VVGFTRQGKGRLKMRIANKIHVTKNQLHFHGAVINGRIEWLRKYSRKTIPYEKYYVLQVKGDSGKPLFLYKFARMSDKKYKEIRAGLDALYADKLTPKTTTRLKPVPVLRPKPKLKEPQKELATAGKK